MESSTSGDRAARVTGFAAELRSLRLASGSPTLARLQSETGISRSVISDAFAGKYLPSARTLAALVPVLGGDAAEWVARRDALATGRDAPPVVVRPWETDAVGVATASEESAITPDEAVASHGSATTPLARGGHDISEGSSAGATTRPQLHPTGRRTVALVGAGGFVAGVAVTALVTALVVGSSASSSMPASPVAYGPTPKISVADGQDPAFTPCTSDAKVVASVRRQAETLIEILWSNDCYAGWGRITRYDGKATGNTVTIAFYPQTAPHGPARQQAVEHDVAAAYTTLVVRPSADTLLCAVGAYSVSGAKVDLGEPICT
ncbi:DUF2690 domain-containing protein [Microbacterium sp. CJ88]|uniref:DUF2690 domain-containing protein n=1 Tax=Microbacterium sp. CJ88 TaxID=3445672 RepID=UPI003F656F13